MAFGNMMRAIGEEFSVYTARIFFVASGIFDVVNDLRIHVLFNYFLVVSWFLKSSGVDTRDAVEYGLTGLSIAGTVYLLNRYADYHYDLIADTNLTKTPHQIYLMTTAIFFITNIPYIVQNPITILPSIFGLTFGTLYSFRTFFRYPLKNYLFTKNLVAAGSKYIATFGGALIFVPFTDLLFARSISMFAFHLIYEILWDIRDMAADRVGKVSTIPLKFGKPIALLACVIIGLVSFSFQFGEVKHTDHFFTKYMIVLFFIGSLVWVKHPRWFHVMIYAHIVLNLVYVNDEILQYISILFLP